jgi:hypothetical protein
MSSGDLLPDHRRTCHPARGLSFPLSRIVAEFSRIRAVRFGSFVPDVHRKVPTNYRKAIWILTIGLRDKVPVD